MRAPALACGLLAACCSPQHRPLDEATLRLDRPHVLELGEAEVPVATAVVDGHGSLAFLVDTGAAITFLDEARAEELGLELRPYSHAGVTTGADGRAVTYERYAVLERLELGPLVLEDVRVPVIEAAVLAQNGWFGILGQDVLGRFPFVLDAGRRALHLLPPGAAQAALEAYLAEADVGDGAWVIAPAEFRPAPFLELRVEGFEEGPLEIEIDTGASRTSLPLAAIEAVGLESQGEYRAAGIAGEHGGRLYRIEDLGLYGLRISATVQESLLEYGLLGMDVLGQLVLLHDAPGGRVWLHRRP